MTISYRQKEGNLTILGLETEFNGELKFSDNLVITGKFSGTIKSTGSLVIEKKSSCTVDIATAESITVAGHVKGNLSALDKLEMLSNSRIVGNVETARLRIADNVSFYGKVKMREQLPVIDIFSVSTAEYKKMVSHRATKEKM